MKKLDTKYARIKPGLYISGATPNCHPPSLNLMYVLSAEYIDKKVMPPFQKEWHGVVYKYFDFGEQKVYEFNQYWDSFIDGLIPIANKRAVTAAKEQIRMFAAKKRKSAETEVAELAVVE